MPSISTYEEAQTSSWRQTIPLELWGHCRSPCLSDAASPEMSLFGTRQIGEGLLPYGAFILRQ